MAEHSGQKRVVSGGLVHWMRGCSYKFLILNSKQSGSYSMYNWTSLHSLMQENGIHGFVFFKDFSGFSIENFWERDMERYRKAKKKVKSPMVIWERNTGVWVYSEKNIREMEKLF